MVMMISQLCVQIVQTQSIHEAALHEKKRPWTIDSLPRPVEDAPYERSALAGPYGLDLKRTIAA